jgi:hypothetical protein
MKKEKLIAELLKLKVLDTESRHREADRLLLEYIGDMAVTAAFESLPKWYA